MNFSNGTLDMYHGPEGLDLPYAVITGIVLFSILFMTVFGNLLVLIAVAINENLRHTTNYFIVNLACADLLLGISVLPFSATLDILGYWPFGSIMCIFWTSVDVLWCTGSIITLCVISVDRYIGITKPLQHGIIMSEKRACWIISLVWVASLAISIGPVFGWRHDRKVVQTSCHVNKEPAYVIFSVTGSFYIPMFVIVFVYYRIFKKVNKHNKHLAKGETVTTFGNSSTKKIKLRVHTGRNSSNATLNGNSKQNMSERLIKFNKQKRAAKTLGIVVGVFILCWFPFFFVLPLGALCSKCSPPENVFKVIFWLGYCNSMMNPVIYGFSSKEFKRAFRNILSCKCRNSDRFKLIQRYSFYDQKERSNSNLSCQNEKSRSIRSGKGDERLSGELLRSKSCNTETEYSPVGKCYLAANPPSFDSDSVSLSDHVLEELRQEQRRSPVEK
ncbi:alpha-1A adrenergic receptor-like [Saccostrea cucullata]|uniref:alpha-1A adrenergic receptor-like n=1 Tax=Saccostrea cuccullata TaxID=36930 RepID=UPI002ED0DB0B